MNQEMMITMGILVWHGVSKAVCVAVGKKGVEGMGHLEKEY